MSKPAIPSKQPTSRNLSVFAVLGLADKSDRDWSRLRGLQNAGLARLTFQRAFAHSLLAVFVARIYLDVVPAWMVLSWMAAVALLNIQSARLDRSFADTDKRKISPAEFNRQTFLAVLTGVFWAVPALVFAPYGSVEDFSALLMLVVLLIASSVFFYTAAPLSILILGFTVGAACIVQLAINELWLVMGATILFLIAAMFGTIHVGRTYLSARLSEQVIAEKEEVVSLLLREFEENEADWLWEIDPSRRLRSVSPRFAFALGEAQSEVQGRPIMELIAGQKWEEGQYDESLRALAECLKRQENFSNLLVKVTIKGAERWWELSGSPMRDHRGRFVGFRGVGSDKTEQRASSEKIAYLARYDTLTSLPNRLQLTEALGRALEDAEKWRTRCALMMVDLDRFKAVNDSLGHMTGDKLLAQVSARLQKLMGEGQLCGRLGGDEFAVVIEDASEKGMISDLARQIIDALSEPYQVEQHKLYVGASVGSAVGPRDGNSVEELMRNADLALYRAKDVGGGEHFAFEQELHANAEERRKLEVSLRSALGQDEFVLHYQPVVDAKSENIVSFEALVRWNSKDHGFVSPGKFIPLAEDTRLIVPIGRWVLYQACQEAMNWPDHIKVNVNVSPEQLLEPDFHLEVVQALTDSGLRPDRLEIEVTESIFVRDASIARAALEHAMALGCSIALDDFGTGYSSLGYIRELRFSTIKVDRLFVQGAAQGASESLAIINAVVAMAKSLDMTTTAEGVENSEEAALIRSLGCDKIQGFYFGRPMSKEEARRLFDASHARQRA
ncbi:bifunctional diguanylate cyclase/phosphodiesterase [Erythrobacter sp. YT30]|uniref:putative bifunctional diguanylate cyclase/phosphodiesterase n=1 Tax=Erythrobacter sp. YT30 TaxID=1735012 RepID=UPI00076C0480|nr:EAL domain-containing protein [Erythrobacter sp. YT30]KWV90519.1 diguanylate cyclase [Erythrobacter sp. YT30]